MTMTLIATATSTGTSNEIVFENIPQNGTDLFLLCSLRSTNSTDEAIGIRFNTSFSGTSYRHLNGTGSSANSTNAAYRSIGAAPGTSRTANTFSNTSVYIPNYTGSQHKTISADNVYENNATVAAQTIAANIQTITDPITQINFDSASSGQNWASGSTISLYQITKGSDGIVTTS